MEIDEQLGIQEETPRPFKEIPALWLKFGRMTKDFLTSEQTRSSLKTTFISIITYALIRACLHFLFSWFDLISFHPEQNLSELFSEWGSWFLTRSFGIFLVIPLLFYAYSGMNFLSAKLLGGKGNYASQTYLLSLFIAPLGFLSASYYFLTSYLTVTLNILGLVVLQILRFIFLLRVFKAAHKMTTSQAFFSYILPHGLILFALLFIILPWWTKVLN